MNLTIKKKLLLLYLLAMALIVVMGSSSLLVFSTLNEAVQSLSRKDAVKLSLAGELNGLMANILGGQQTLLAAALEHDGEGFSIGKSRQNVRMVSLKDIIQRFEPLLVTVEGKAMVARLDADSEQIASRQQEFLALLEKNQIVEAQKLLKLSLIPVSEDAGDIGAQLLKWENLRFQKTGGEVVGDVSLGRWVIGAVLTLCALLGIWNYRVICELDLELRNTVDEMMQGAVDVAGAAAQIAHASERLAQETTQQAASLQETSASSSEVSSMARMNVEQSSSAATLSTSLGKEMDLNRIALDSAVLAMAAIAESSDKIQKIINVIDRIAFQTNILSLNAAVEAARAGQAGVGFAVVADEVRNLAIRSAEAAHDTSDLVQSCVSASQSGKTRVEEVAVGGQRISKQFAGILSLVDQINQGSIEQGKGSSQISSAIVNMEQSTQQNAAVAEESAAAALQLNGQSENLKLVACRLRAMVVAE